MQQLMLEYEPGLTERYSSLMDAVRAQAYQARSMKTLAADMDLSQSDLSRKLSANPEDTRRMTVDDLERFLQVTGPGLVMQWLAERFLRDPEAARDAALAELARLLPKLQALAKAAGTK